MNAAIIVVGLLTCVFIPDAERDGVEAVRQWAQSRLHEGEAAFDARGFERAQSPRFWGDEVVYAIQIDRFNDGDFTNNARNLPAMQRAALQAHDDAGRYNDIALFRHGGDLAGVQSRLDYIRELGVTTLWLTPVFRHDGSYHGYCPTDLTQIDPGFGDGATLQDLVAQAHARGLNVVLDVVVNHLCDTATFYDVQPEHARCVARRDQENWDDRPNDRAGQGRLAFSPTFFGPLRSQHFYSRCGANGWDETSGEGSAAVFGDFVATMFDYDTRNEDLQAILTDLHKYWIGFADVDGFRLDAAKHVTEDFLARFSTESRRYARQLGKENFYIVGEVAAGEAWVGRRLGRMFSDTNNPDRHGVMPRSATRALWQLRDAYLSNSAAPYPGLSGVFDFAASRAARDVLLGRRPTSTLESLHASSWERTLRAQNDPRLNWTHLEIHDWPRFVRNDRHNPSKSALGVAVLALLPGMPVYHYGQEQGFNGDCHWDRMPVGAATHAVRGLCASEAHELSRQDMFIGGLWKLGSTVPAVDALAGINTPDTRAPAHWQEDPMLQLNHEVFRSAQRTLALRKSCTALRYGDFTPRWSDPAGAGVLAFSRQWGAQEILVVANTQPFAVPLPRMGLPGTVLNEGMLVGVNDTQGIGASVRLGAWGSYVDFGAAEVPGNSVLVYAAPDQLQAWNEALQLHLCKG